MSTGRPAPAGGPGLRSVSYVARNLAKNALSPLAASVLGDRAVYGIDGDLDLVMAALDRMAEPLAAAGVRVAGADVLELGPGRTSEVSAAFALAGARRATGLDVAVRVQGAVDAPDRYTGLTERLAVDGGRFLAAVGADAGTVRDRAAELAGTGYPVTIGAFDGSRLPLPDGSVDVVVSKSVLEHVRVPDVPVLLGELSRVLRPGGVMVHMIDLRDHLHIVDDDHEDGDWLEALRYPEPLFRAMFDRRSTRINRLRARQWREHIAGAGFETVHWAERRCPLDPSFRADGLRPPWRGYGEDELSVGWVDVAARRPGP